MNFVDIYAAKMCVFFFLSCCQAYLQRLVALEKKPLFQHVAVRCICSLLDANPHFNFRESLLEATIRNISSTDEAIRFYCIFAVDHSS